MRSRTADHDKGSTQGYKESRGLWCQSQHHVGRYGSPQQSIGLDRSRIEQPWYGHELSALMTLPMVQFTVMVPAWMKYVMKHDVNRFAQIAVRFGDAIWTMPIENTALEGIKRLEEFWDPRPASQLRG